MKISLLAILFSLTMVAAPKGENDKITGVWWNEEKTSRVEVYEENGKIYGKVVWLKDNTNADGSSPRLDSQNPETSLQKRPVVGVRILKNLAWDADDEEWDDGEIYDPKSGKTYSCYAKLEKDGKLYLKGYVMGMPFLGRSTLWTRYK